MPLTPRRPRSSKRNAERHLEIAPPAPARYWFACLSAEQRGEENAEPLLKKPPADNAARALAVLSVCPACAGQGKEPHDGDWSNPDAEMVECNRCDGTADLLGALLERAYSRGRADALIEARGGLEQVAQLLERDRPPWLTGRELRRMVGA